MKYIYFAFLLILICFIINPKEYTLYEPKNPIVIGFLLLSGGMYICGGIISVLNTKKKTKENSQNCFIAMTVTHSSTIIIFIIYFSLSTFHYYILCIDMQSVTYYALLPQDFLLAILAIIITFIYYQQTKYKFSLERRLYQLHN